MRILLVSPLPPPEGGIATWTKQYKNYCQKNNIELSIVNIALLGKRLDKINNKLNMIDEIRRSVNIFKNLRKEIMIFKPNVIHINSSCARFGLWRDAICVYLAKRKKQKVVLHCRCTIQDRLGKSRILHRVFAWIAKSSDIVLTLNASSEEYVKNIAQCQNVRTIPNFISLDSDWNKIEINEVMRKVVFVGHVQFDKGIREIFTTAYALPTLEFILVGPISKEVKNMSCPTNVQLLGGMEHDKAISIMHSSDVFLFPSYTEGFANALVEAMACGLPVIASDAGANQDMLENFGGYVVPIRDSEQIIEALYKMRDVATRKKMSEWNQKKVYEKYRIEIVMEQLLSIYKEIIK